MSAKDYQKDYYKTLGVPKTATAAEIKKSYRELARKWHPDANKGSADAEERFKEITEAYNVLSDEKQRKEYDEARSMFGGFRVPTGAPARPGPATPSTSATSSAASDGLGDVLGGIFRNRPAARRGQPGAARRGRGDRDHAVLRRRDRRRDRVAAADRRGSLPGLRRHRREVGHGAQGLPGLPRHRAAVDGTSAASGSPSPARPAGAAASSSRTRASRAAAAAGR